MLNWFKEQAAKFFPGQVDGRTARGVDRCLFELAQLRQELTERDWSVDKIVIERLQTDKVELNLGSIDVTELSGMLSIGFNYGGRLIKTGSPGGGKTLQQPLERRGRQKSPAAPQGVRHAEKGGVKQPGAGGSKAARQPGEPLSEGKAAAKACPHLTIKFRGQG